MTFVCSYFFWHDPYRSRFESDLGKQGEKPLLTWQCPADQFGEKL